MAFDSNAWRRINYTAWAPVYNLLAWPMTRLRRRSLELLDAKPGERVLIVGAGTGLDLDYLEPRARVTAVDLTPAMLGRLRVRANTLGLDVRASLMDGCRLALADGCFDAVILHLILAVIPDPQRCVAEAARVLRPGGRAVVFDKFIPDDSSTPVLMRAINPLFNCFGTSITRKLGPIVAGSGLRIAHDQRAGFGGLYRIVLLEKPPPGSQQSKVRIQGQADRASPES